MTDEDKASIDILWKMYAEHCTQGRHHETQRSTVIGIVLAVSAAIIGVITFDKQIAGRGDWPLSLLVIALGIFGAGFCMKHYERFSLHMQRARYHRDALDALLPGMPLRRLKSEADERHSTEFPVVQKWRLHRWWVVLNLFVVTLGGGLFVISVWFPIVTPQ